MAGFLPVLLLSRPVIADEGVEAIVVRGVTIAEVINAWVLEVDIIVLAVVIPASFMHKTPPQNILGRTYT